MASIPTGYVLVQHKKYPYFIASQDDGNVYFKCEGALLDQLYEAEDIPQLLENLPAMILDELQFQADQRDTQQVLRFRVSSQEKCLIEKKSREQGFESTSEFIRALTLRA